MMASNAKNFKNFSPHHPLDVLVALLSILTLIHGEVTSASVCKLSIADNKTLFDTLDEKYEEEATTIIIEYTVGFNNVSADFDLRNKSSPESFQPWRWYSTQGLSSSRLLLTYSFLYGTMKFFLSLGIDKVDLSIDVSPPGCLESYENEDLENFIRSFLMEGEAGV
ncbi:unnamed protein product [Lymnaea stagnalis]|uniref:Uncharacterized protein n=1 Tax=Lymnaea stagnalis TaxID=6523 RepID=A0AAV2I6F9_LYMST